MIRAYHRPTSIGEALELLAGPDRNAVLLGGGTEINGLPSQEPEEVVDLQGVGLDQISRDGTTLLVEAMVTLRDFVDYESTPPLLRDLARREAPNTIRNAATIGGTVASANPESGLIAGLLAYSATVSVVGTTGSRDIALSDLVGDDNTLAGSIIASVRFEVGGHGVFEATARTPADTPIVLVAGHHSDEGTVLLAATGVASRPVVIDPDDIGELDPPADFRGSAEYRRHLAGTLAARVVSQLSAEDQT